MDFLACVGVMCYSIVCLVVSSVQGFMEETDGVRSFNIVIIYHYCTIIGGWGRNELKRDWLSWLRSGVTAGVLNNLDDIMMKKKLTGVGNAKE